jgi:hypothetical protein
MRHSNSGQGNSLWYTRYEKKYLAADGVRHPTLDRGHHDLEYERNISSKVLVYT